MVQFLNGNPVTDTIAANQARDLQQLQLANSLMDARDARVQRQNQDRAGRAIAGIFAEPDATTAPAPAPAAPTGLQSLAQQVGGQPMQEYAAQVAPAPAAPQARSPLASVTADNIGDRYRRAISVAAQQPGGGPMAMQLAGQYQQQQQAQIAARQKRDDHVLGMLGDGDVEGARQYASLYGLTHLQPLFDNPKALVTVSSIGKLSKNLGIKDEHAGLFTGKVLEGLSQGLAYPQALQAGFKAVGQAPQPVAHVVTDDSGKVYGITKDGQGRQITGVQGKTKGAGGNGGGGGGESKAIQTARWQITQLQKAINPRTGQPFTEQEATAVVLKANQGDITAKDRLRHLGALRKDAMGDEAGLPAKLEADVGLAQPRPPTGPAVPAGIPQGAKQIGTSGGKPVYQAPDGKRYIVE